MDFFDRQQIARSHTKRLEVYFGLAVAGIIAMVYLVAVLISAYVHFHGALRSGYNTYGADPNGYDLWWQPKLLLGTAIGTVAFIFCASAWKTAQLADGGSAVAELLGGRPIAANTSDPDERKLLNVVEEMAIASGTPVPHVYVLPGERGINAFAAGHSTSDMVICATRGCLKLLTRDELQGVIGHEFSHILNGDMRLNLRLMGLIFGILCLAIFGRILLSMRSGSSQDRNPLPLLGLALLAIGSLGVFFGKLIKSAISRQREFLADASSVQFTRNPEGLAGALKKVGGSSSLINDPNAEDASHFFFANGLTESFSEMFSTHPPLDQRIRALEPTWDGKFVVPDVQSAFGDGGTGEGDEERAARKPPPLHPVRAPQLGDLLGGKALGSAAAIPMTIATASILMQAGTPTAKHLDYAADLRSKMPESLAAAARDPMSAVALIYSLLLAKDVALRARQLEQLQKQAAPGISQEAQRLFADVINLDPRARMPLAALAMTALRRLSAPQYEEFAKNLKFIMESDNQIELFEYTLQKIVLRQLEPNFRPVSRVVTQYYVLKPLVADCVVLLSALAHAGQTDRTQAATAFRRGAALLNVPNLELLAPEECGLDKVDASLARLNQGAPPVKKLVLNACAETVAADGVIEENEAELLRAIADTLDCPIPPIISL